MPQSIAPISNAPHRDIPAFGSDTTNVRYRNPDTAAIVLGLKPLNQDTRSRVQEIRIWTVVEIGIPHDLLRLVKRGDRVSGMYGRWWPQHPITTDDGEVVPEGDPFLPYWLEGPCGPMNRVSETMGCVTRLVHEPDWGRMWDSLTALGIWALPDQSRLAPDPALNDGKLRMTMDGVTMTVEVRDHERYRSYAYSNPDGGTRPAERAAAAIMAIDDNIDREAHLPTHASVVRGKLKIARGAATLTRCGSDTLMAVRTSLGPRLDSLRDRSGSDSTISESFLVRVRAVQMNLAIPPKRRLREYANIDVDSVFS
ncbi:MAG: hypothetical protein ABIZ70_14935, partial [Gemmatimonadales bacterium]